MKTHRLLLAGLLVVTTCMAMAQSQQLNGVYVGAELYTRPFEGMQINHIVLYFRNDGTFTDQLNIPGWQTRVSGAYSIQNNMVLLQFNNGNESKKYKLSANGNLESTAGIKHTLHKVKKISTLPAAAYEKRTASTSGGAGTGMPQVGAFSSSYLYFDGKGNFSFNRSAIVGIGGDVTGGTIGGKSGKEEKAGGTYKLGDGEITLVFHNGTVSKHSFFYSPPSEEDLIVLDGEFYFREEEKSTANAETAPGPDRNNSTAPRTGAVPAATDLLQRLRVKYGGDNIDKITTVKETAVITGNLQAVFLTDIAHNKTRIEVRQGSKLLLVKQWESGNGWQWANGTKKTLTPDEAAEMELGLYQGVLGLHKKLNSSFLTGTVSRSGNDYLVTFLLNGHKLVYLLGDDYTLKGNAYSVNGVQNIAIYRNFVEKNGIAYPAVTESSDGKNKLTANTTSILFNVALTDDDWKTP